MEHCLPSTSGREKDAMPFSFTSFRQGQQHKRHKARHIQTQAYFHQQFAKLQSLIPRTEISQISRKTSKQKERTAREAYRRLAYVCCAAQAVESQSLEGQVLQALENVIDPDFGASIVACEFVKELRINEGNVSFDLELTTPACPVKDQFKRQCEEFVGQLPWVKSVSVTFSAQAATPQLPQSSRPPGLKGVSHVIAVSSCKGGVGKSTTAVNLAYTLAQMGAKVGIFDADVYGPSLPTMVSPKDAVLKMDPATKQITPAEYEGVKLVSFGFAGQGSAIMRGAMVSGLIEQLLTTTQWGELDYLVVDFPPGTGDIQLTLCQSAQFSAAVIVTTPQKLSFIDVAKGIRMFARLEVPCVAVVENMSFFEVDGVRHHPFGKGSGDRIIRDFGLQNLVHFPIVPDLSAAGDGGKPLVIAQPSGNVASAFMELGSCVVREISKLQAAAKASLRYDEANHVLVLRRVDGSESSLHPAYVRRNDTSATSINEWTGEKMPQGGLFSEDIKPSGIQAIGNYAVLIMWEDGFNQVAPFSHLDELSQRQGQDDEAKEKLPEFALS